MAAVHPQDWLDGLLQGPAQLQGERRSLDEDAGTAAGVAAAAGTAAGVAAAAGTAAAVAAAAGPAVGTAAVDEVSEKMVLTCGGGHSAL